MKSFYFLFLFVFLIGFVSSLNIGVDNPKIPKVFIPDNGVIQNANIVQNSSGGNSSFNQSLTNSLYLNLSGTNANQNINISNFNFYSSFGYAEMKNFNVLNETVGIQFYSSLTGQFYTILRTDTSLASYNLYLGILAGDGQAETGGYVENTFVGTASGGNIGIQQDDNTAIGAFSAYNLTNGSYNTYLGAYADTLLGIENYTVSIGYAAMATKSNQLVVGTSNTNGVNDSYLGQGVTAISPQGITIQATGGSGTNNKGGDLTFAPGKNTGNQTSARIFLSFPINRGNGSYIQNLTNEYMITNSTIYPMTSGTKDLGNATSVFRNASLKGLDVTAPGGTAITVGSSAGTAISVSTASTALSITGGGSISASSSTANFNVVNAPTISTSSSPMTISPTSGSLTIRSSSTQPLFISSGNGRVDLNVSLNSSHIQAEINLTTRGNLSLLSNFSKIQIRESLYNSTINRGALVAGKIKFNNTLVTNNTRVFCFIQIPVVANIGTLYLNGIAEGNHYNISSSNVLDTSTIECLLVEAT